MPVPPAPLVDSNPLLSYDFDTIELILEAYGIQKGYEGPFAQNALTQYFYPFQPLVPNLFAEDNIAYFLAQKGEITERRVCFLIKTPDQRPLAMMIQLTNMNKELAKNLYPKLVASELWKEGYLKEESQLKKAIQTLLNNPSVLNEFKGLYQNIHCLFMGSLATSALIEQLKPPLSKAYAGQLRLDCLDFPANNPSIVLTENIISMFFLGKTEEVDSAKAHSKHQKQFFQKTLQFYQDKSATITAALTHLSKYAILMEYRQKNEKGIYGNDWDAIEDLLDKDIELKKQIYTIKLNHPSQAIQYLSIDLIQRLLELKEDEEKFLECLNQEIKARHQQSKDWENNWRQTLSKESWFSYVWRGLKNVVKTLYQHSLVSLGAELTQWFGEPLMNWLGGFSFIQNIKNFAKQTIEKNQNRLPFAQRFSSLSETLFSPELLSAALKITGAGVGLVYSYFLGNYTLFRMMAVNLVAFKLNEYQQRRRVNDTKARVSDRYLTGKTLVRLMSISVTFLETYFTGRYRYFISALGGLAGSFGIEKLAQTLIPDLQYKEGEGTKDQVFSLLLLSTAGQDIGYSLTNFGVNIWENIATKFAIRDSIIEANSNAKYLLDFKLSAPSMLTDPRLWFNEDNPVEVEWHDHEGAYYKTFCQTKAVSYNTAHMECLPIVRQQPRLQR